MDYLLVLILLSASLNYCVAMTSAPYESLDSRFQANLDLFGTSFYPVGTTGSSETSQPGGQEEDIAGGIDALSGFFPFVASLQVRWSDGKNYHICTAVLYKPKKLITAAHCAIYMQMFDHYVSVGLTTLSEGGLETQKVKAHYIHPDFDATGNGFPMDIMIIELENEVTLSTFVQLATLATFKDVFVNYEDCHVMGWGRTVASNETSAADTLQFATMKAISNNDCRKFFRVFQFYGLQQYHKCAWNWDSAPCRGDSGSPLVCGGKIVGLASYGSKDCDGCFPFVFTNVAYHRGWMDKIEKASLD